MYSSAVVTNMKIFSGSSTQQLAKELSEISEIPLGDTYIDNFPNTELRVRVENVDDHAILVQSFSQPVNDNIIQFMLLADALKRSGVKHITAVIPWFGYSKQDKVFRQGEPLSVKVIANLIQTAKVDKVISFDLHNPSIAGYFDIPVENLSAFKVFTDSFTENQIDKGNTIVIAPDAGSIKSSTLIAQELGLQIAYINKQRDIETGEVSIQDIDKDISGKDCLIFDDMIATGGTMIKVSNFLKKKGAGKISIFATHHLYIPRVQSKLDNSDIDEIHVTNTVKVPSGLSSPKLKVHSVAEMLSESI